jgi:porphobilinogen deaminase
MRIDDPDLESVKNIIHDHDSYIATSIERDVMARFGGGCGLPLGVYAFKYDGGWKASGFWGGVKGRPRWAKVSGRDPSDLPGKLYDGLTCD